MDDEMLAMDDYDWGGSGVVVCSRKPIPSRTKCRYCDTKGLHWRRISGRWELWNTRGGKHLCVNGEEFNPE